MIEVGGGGSLRLWGGWWIGWNRMQSHISSDPTTVATITTGFYKSRLRDWIDLALGTSKGWLVCQRAHVAEEHGDTV